MHTQSTLPCDIAIFSGITNTIKPHTNKFFHLNHPFNYRKELNIRIGIRKEIKE